MIYTHVTEFLAVDFRFFTKKMPAARSIGLAWARPRRGAAKRREKNSRMRLAKGFFLPAFLLEKASILLPAAVGAASGGSSHKGSGRAEHRPSPSGGARPSGRIYTERSTSQSRSDRSMHRSIERSIVRLFVRMVVREFVQSFVRSV